MSMSATHSSLLLPPSSSKQSREQSRTRVFFDDLLLPSSSGMRLHKIGKSRSQSPRALTTKQLPLPLPLPLPLALSVPGSPLRSLSGTRTKSRTAPASPHHSISIGSSANAAAAAQRASFLTPTSSPGSLGGSPTHLNHYPVPNENYSGALDRSVALLNQLNETLRGGNSTSASTSTGTSAQVPLPPLRHLQLLPDHRIQENAHLYPDTSETTPSWHRALADWCRRDAAPSYARIQQESASTRTGARAQGYTNMSAAIVAEDGERVPSVLQARDAFQQLTQKGAEHRTATPVTPPMSPRRRSTTTTTTTTSQFSPFVSEKLVQHVKAERAQASHKKTNSFKALQIKNLLDDRDILSTTSKKVTKGGRRGSSKTGSRQLPQTFYTSSTLASPSRAAKAKALALGPRGQGQLVLRLSRDTQTSAHSSRSSSPTRSRSGSRSPTRSRSRSPTRSPRTPNFHRFPVDSSPASPKNGDVTLTPAALPLPLPQPHSKATKSSAHGHGHGHAHRVCVSCHSSDSPCWRPSWSPRRQDQLCNSCGLRYKKTHTRCLNDACRKIPTKGELNIMRANGVQHGTVAGLSGTREGYRCLFCNTITHTEA